MFGLRIRKLRKEINTMAMMYKQAENDLSNERDFIRKIHQHKLRFANQQGRKPRKLVVSLHYWEALHKIAEFHSHKAQKGDVVSFLGLKITVKLNIDGWYIQ